MRDPIQHGRGADAAGPEDLTRGVLLFREYRPYGERMHE